MNNYPNTIQIGDLKKISYKDGILSTEIGNFKTSIDMIIFGSPCLSKTSLVLTKSKGYIPIIDIEIGDYVLSHDNKYHKVIDIMYKGKKNIYQIDSMCSNTIEATSNHKFYTREKYKKWNNSKRSYDRLFKDPEWLNVLSLTKNHYLGYAINKESKIPIWNGVNYWKQWKIQHVNTLDMSDKNLWYLIGRWLGDGWFTKNRKGKYRNKYNGIKICCKKGEENELEKHINLAKFNYNKIEDKTVYKFQITNTELATFLSQFGDGAINKKIPSMVFDLPINLLTYVLHGYFDSDGHCENNKEKISCSSVSKNLIYGIGQCVAKVYNRPFSIGKVETSDTYEIEGRTVNQKDYYTLSFKKTTSKYDNAFYENGYIWFPIRKIINTNNIDDVYDLSVENACSFTANGSIVHNCQSFSIAMTTDKRIGREDKEKSGLFDERYRILQEVNPKYFLMENVASMKNEDRDYVTKLMKVEPIMINSELVAPCIRKRYYWTNMPNITQPKRIDICLQDILDDGYTNREKGNCLMVSDCRPTTTPIKMFHRYHYKSFTNLIFKSKEHYEKCKEYYDNHYRGMKAKDIPTNETDIFDGVRFLSQEELERCQTIPQGYTKCLTRNEVADVIGDGWTINTIVHILSFIPEMNNIKINK